MMLVPVGFMLPATAGGSPAFTGALDSYTASLWSACGIKCLISSYSGPLLRVRRSSDSTEMDVGFNAADGTLNTVAMLAWSGADSVFVVKAYDQSGAGNDFIQATTTKQPRIANAGTYDGFMRWDGTDDILQSLNGGPTNAGMSIGGRYTLRAAAGAGASQTVWTQEAATGRNTLYFQQQQNNGSYNGYLFTGTTQANTTWGTVVTTEVVDLVCADRSLAGTAEMVLYRGGALQTVTTTSGGNATSNFTAATIYIGSQNGSQPAVMSGKWFAVWSNSQAANGAAITAAL